MNFDSDESLNVRITTIYLCFLIGFRHIRNLVLTVIIWELKVFRSLWSKIVDLPLSSHKIHGISDDTE